MVRKAIAGVAYSMTFEFLIVCNAGNRQDIDSELIDAARQVLEEIDTEYEFDEDMLNDMVRIQYERNDNANADVLARVVIGFSLELPNEIVVDKSIIENFVGYISGSNVISHTVKFEDPLLQTELSLLADEIFKIEMKLRRVLSLIYLNTYQDTDPYDLFSEERTNPRHSSRGEMASLSENQFFHLNFRQYTNLNAPREPQISEIMEFIRSSDQYDEFRSNIIDRLIVTDDRDVSFLENLKRLMDPIEEMRNCVAHNRRPPDNISQNYPQAREGLESLIDDYLEQWEVQEVS